MRIRVGMLPLGGLLLAVGMGLSGCEDLVSPSQTAMTCAGDDASEPNDDRSHATAATLGEQNGTICMAAKNTYDPDFFVLSGKPGRRYGAEFLPVAGVDSASLCACNLTLWDGDTQLGPVGGEFVMPASGRAVLEVGIHFKQDAGPYRLRLSLPNGKPLVSFTSTPRQPQLGEEVTFTSTSNDPDGDALVQSWRFGDGATATGAVAQHGYTAGGPRTVWLVATDEFGARDSASAGIDVKVNVSSVEMQPSRTELYSLGDTIRMAVVARDRLGGVVSGRPVTWSVSNQAVLTIRDGTVTAVGEGTAVVTAVIDGVVASASVVVDQRVARLVVQPASVQLSALGATSKLTVRAEDARGNVMPDSVVQWRSADTLVAVVDAQGTVTARGNGSTVVSAELGGVQASAAVVVQQVVSTIRIAAPASTFEAIGDTLQLVAELLDARGHPVAAQATWNSGGAAVQVDASGRAWAVAAGSATITATYQALSADVVLSVVPVVAQIAVTPNPLVLRVGDSGSLSAAAADRRGHPIPSTFTWTSANPATASVTATGVVTAESVGTVQVTASTGARSASATVQVTYGSPADYTRTGDGQSGTAGTALAQQIGVRVLDGRGLGVGDLSITFAAASGSVTPAVVVTDSEGWARATWTLGASAGAQSASAAIPGLGTVSFTATAAAAPGGGGSISISPVSGLIDAIGGEVQFTATVTDGSGSTVPGATIAWQVGDTTVARLIAAGRVRSYTNGSTMLYARSGALVDSVPVVVSQVAASVQVSPASATLAVGESLLFSAVVRDALGVSMTAAVTWTSSNAGAATVSAGLVQAVGGGSTTIRASVGAISGTAAVTVTSPSAVAHFFSYTGDLQVGYSNEAAPDSIVITTFANQTCDSDGCYPSDPIGNVRVYLSGRWGTAPATLFTDSTGRAAFRYTMGSHLGVDTLRIWVDSARARIGWSSYADTAFVRLLATERVTQPFTQVSASGEGGSHTCGIVSDGTAYCWGDNASGKLGIGNTAFRYVDLPVKVAGGHLWQSISASGWHSCGVTTGGEAYCWGDDDHIGATRISGRDTSVPVAVETAERFTKVSAGMWSTCAIGTTGLLWCWGDNSYGALGDGTTTWRQTPVRSSSALTFTDVSMGTIFYGCGIVTGGDAYCWGANSSGQLGDSTRTSQRVTPVLVKGSHSFSRISAHEDHTCAITTGGAAWCWGYNGSGELGIGNTTSFITGPAEVLGGRSYRSIDAGQYHTCAVATDGTAWCWGLNDEGQFGVGSSTSPSGSTSPVLSAGGLTFDSISAGDDHTCAVRASGEAYCWGSNWSGQGGVGTTVRNLLNPGRVGG